MSIRAVRNMACENRYSPDCHIHIKLQKDIVKYKPIHPCSIKP